MTLESTITASILKALRKRGAYVVKVHGGPMQPASIDILACYKGRFLGIEVKRPRARVTLRQTETLAQITRAGGLGVIARSVKDVDLALEVIDNG